MSIQKRFFSIASTPIIGISNTETEFSFSITLGEGYKINPCLYKKGDVYIFHFLDRFDFFSVTTLPSLYVEFLRLNKTDPTDTCPQKLSLKKNINNYTIPSIDIKFQSLIDGSDIGNTTFTISDNFQYYNHKTTPIIPNHICQTLQTNNIKITIFNRNCPLIFNILKGKGNTAWEKVGYLFDNMDTNFDDIYNFFIEGIVRYSMLKYVLARLMYGKFNIKYVLNKYNNKFLKDLKHTRFCNFVFEFTDPNSNIFGYDKYFL